MKKHVAAHLAVRVLSVEHYSEPEPEPRTLQLTLERNSLERNTVEKFGDCVTLSPVCVTATKVEFNFHICYEQENGSYGSVIRC